MTAETSFDSLREFHIDATEVSIILGTHDQNGLPILQLAAVHDDVAGSFKDIGTSYLATISDRVLRPYDAGYEPGSHELTYIEVRADDVVQAFLEAFTRTAAIPSFSGDDAFTEHVAFYALAFENVQAERLIMFRRTSRSFQLEKNKRRWFTLSDGYLSEIRENAYAFDKNVDCLTWDGYLYIDNQFQFESVFRYLGDIERKAVQVVDSFVASVPLANEADFREAILRDRNMMGKLAKISRKPYIAGLTMADVTRVIDAFGLDIDIDEGEDGAKRLIFSNSPQRRWKIVTLLDDGFLQSSLTALRYETNSKTQL